MRQWRRIYFQYPRPDIVSEQEGSSLGGKERIHTGWAYAACSEQTRRRHILLRRYSRQDPAWTKKKKERRGTRHACRTPAPTHHNTLILCCCHDTDERASLDGDNAECLKSENKSVRRDIVYSNHVTLSNSTNRHGECSIEMLALVPQCGVSKERW